MSVDRFAEQYDPWYVIGDEILETVRNEQEARESKILAGGCGLALASALGGISAAAISGRGELAVGGLIITFVSTLATVIAVDINSEISPGI